MLDVESAAAAGVDLDRLLWIRGHVVSNPGLCRDLNQRALEQAIRAFTLVLQAGNFGLVVFDVAEAPADALRRLPFTTWLRLQRIVEGSQTACVLVGGEPMARSSAGLTLRAGIRDSDLGFGNSFRFVRRIGCPGARRAGTCAGARRRRRVAFRPRRISTVPDPQPNPNSPSPNPQSRIPALYVSPPPPVVDQPAAAAIHASRSRRSSRRGTSGTATISCRSTSAASSVCSARRGPSARSCGAKRPRAASACTSPSPARGWRRSSSRSRVRG